MYKTVRGKKILVNFFLIAAAILLMLFASFTSAKICGTAIKLSLYTSVHNINLTKNIKCTTNKQAGKLVKSDIRKQWLIVT
jgi:hypothetical protein